MAGINHPIIAKGSRNKPAAVVASLFLLLQVLSPLPARCDYRINTSNGEILTQSYWIQDDTVYLYEDTPPIELSEISYIKEESFTALESDMNKDALKRFFRYSTWLITKEDNILLSQQENLEAMKAIDELRGAEDKRSGIKNAVKALSERLEELESRGSMLKERWSQARIPERELVAARDVKYLQLLSMRSSIRQCRRYLKTWDPTCREYALEQYEQAVLFEKGFYDALARSMKR